MPTRLYLANTATPAVTPTGPCGIWANTSQFVVRALLAAKDAAESLALGTRVNWDAATENECLDRQYVSAGLSPGIVFTSGSTTVKAQLACREFNAGDNSTSRLGVFIMNAAGNSIAATLLSVGQYGPATEYINNATLQNKTFADGDTVTASYTTSAGDLLVVEFGHADAAGATPEGQARYGAPSATADHGANETETTSLVPWIEFSNTITFGGSAPIPPRPAIIQAAVQRAASW